MGLQIPSGGGKCRSPDVAACGEIRVLWLRFPGLRRKRLHPGYLLVVRQVLETRHFGRDAENQAMDGNQPIEYAQGQPTISVSR